MGADPTAIFVGLGLPKDLPTAWLDGLTDGFGDECALVGASVAGGDIAKSDQVVLGVTALGDLGGRAPVTRSGARPGQVVAMAGRLGHAAAGLALFLAGRDGSSFPELADAHRRPQPPYACGPEAARLGATAMVDVSDGLLQDVGHIASASGVRVELEPGALPVPEPLVAAAAELGEDPLLWVLTGGDDHALVAVFPPDVRLPQEWRIIGHVVEGEGVQVTGYAEPHGGWDHFRE
ncbi:MAG: thiamine-phosphate kinase [Sphaerisporangium sp.]|jgi:thiamine-monophosphate kinase|nr:thiamine-phosphate kinase [Sphaerisporangium sp.]